MEQLGRTEETILLSIWRLQDDAYGVTIRKDLKKRTGESWSVGAIYAPLQRLERKGLVSTRLGESEAKRGGRRTVLYTLTSKGRTALVELRTANEALWQGITGLKISR